MCSLHLFSLFSVSCCPVLQNKIYWIYFIIALNLRLSVKFDIHVDSKKNVKNDFHDQNPLKKKNNHCM